MNDELIGKYLAGEAMPEEATALEEWLEQSPDNREYFQRLSELWYTAAGSKGHVLPDKQNVFGEISRQTLARPGTAPKKKQPLPRGLIIAASVVVVTVSLLLGLRKHRTEMPATVIPVSFTTNEAIYRDTLANGVILILNSHSYVRLTNDHERELLDGQLFITAPAKDSFTVKADDVVIKAMDAAFSVSNSTKSGDIIIWGRKGTVTVYTPKGLQTVAAGSRLHYHFTSGTWDRDTIYAANEIAFATRIFDFQDERLEDIMQQIGKAYEVKCLFQNPQLKDCRMSGSFEDQSLKYVMDIIAATLSVEYKIQSDTVIINGKACE